MTDITSVLNSLSPEKKALLEQKLKKNASKYNAFPLSFAQQRLWFLNQLEPESAAYNVPAAVELSGSLSITALEKSINEIINRHEILRTVFRVIDSVPVQIVLPFSHRELNITDFSNINESENRKKTLEIITKEKNHIFDLSSGPLFIYHLYKISENTYILFFLMHHIITDGWSVEILIHELDKFYDSFIRNAPAELPKLAIQYADFSVWQKKWMDGEIKQKQLEYWKKKLNNIPASMELPGEKLSKTEGDVKCIERSLYLPVRYLTDLKKLSAREGTTTYMVFLAILKILLYRHTYQKDICIGTPVANRNRSEIEPLMGFFVNTLVMRSVIAENVSFNDFLNDVKRTAIEAFANQDLPFDKLVEELNAGRNKSPLFRVMYAYQSSLKSHLALSDLKIIPLEIESDSTKYDLTFSVTEDPDSGITVSFIYMNNLFSQETIDTLLKHFHVLTDSIISNPGEKICSLSLFTEKELEKILYEWNKCAAPQSEPKPFHRLFEEQVNKTPRSFAVIADTKQMTYSELNSHANMLAHYLMKRGIGQESIVGICLGRSVDLVVAILAVIKAGGTYLPFDPVYPKDRIDYILKDAGVKMLITEESILAELPENLSNMICIDRDWNEILFESDENPGMDIPVQSAVYIIYTSGSTGKPKGTVIQHNEVYNLYLSLKQHIYSVYNREFMRVSLNASVMFDASVQQIIMLLSGYTLYLIPEEIKRDPYGLRNYIIRNRIDVLDCVPTQLKMLLETDLFRGDSIRPLIVLPGGEAIDENMWKKLNRIEGTDFYNMYGPTECTVDTVMCRIKNHPEIPSIGKPLSNTQAYILDSSLNIVPVGTPGELYIGGAQVGRGYLNRPDLTAEKFIPDPFSLKKGGRLYKTGDLARYNYDGTIEYLGRIDNQVKIRGYRIELGEIESVLMKCSGVKEALIVLKEDHTDKYLAGYIVSKNGNALNIPELKETLRKDLPVYMIPSVIMQLNSMPLLPNGKIDRKSLPEPICAEKDDQEIIFRELTPTEEIVSGIIAGILNRNSIGLNDDIFELGVHSLLATKIVSRLRSIFRMDLELKAIFDNPTVGTLSRQIDILKSNNAGIVETKINTISREEPLPLSFAQERLWFLDQLEPGSTLYNVPEAFRISADLDIGILERSINDIIKRHEILRTTFVTVKGKPYQTITSEFNINVPVIDIQYAEENEQEDRIRELIIAEIQKPFSLEHLPLFRTLLIKISGNQYVLIMTFHHIITDGWSSKILLNELLKIYSHYKQEKDAAIPELKIQYADYAFWQRKYFSEEIAGIHLDYWTQKLKGSLPNLELPVDKPRPDVQSKNGSSLTFDLSKELYEGIRRINRDYNTTLFMSLLSVFQVLLFRYTRQSDILIGTPIANRNRSDIEDLIGFFVNTLVIRGSLSGEMKFTDLLSQTKENLLEAYMHQDMPFEKLVDSLQPERSINQSPLFQVMFTLQNLQPEMNFSEYGIDVHPIEIPSSTSKFDIILSVVEEKENLRVSFEFNTDLFNKETIQNMFKHYRRIIECIIKTPELRLAGIPLLAEEEEKEIAGRLTLGNIEENYKDKTLNSLNYSLLTQKSVEKVICHWNKGQLTEEVKNDNYPELFHKLFEQQASKSPCEHAVVTAEGSLSFGELNRRANLLAHYLRSRGVTSDEIVGICLSRRVELVVAILGIMKAGGGYLPFDPVYPKERINYILKDAGVKLLISEETLLKELPELSCSLICIDRDWEEISKENDGNPQWKVWPENIAYVIYTSGSTGKPKGSVIQHNTLFNLYEILYKSYLSRYPSRKFHVGINSTIMFDASVLQMLFLLYGHTVYITPEEIRRDGNALTGYIKKNKIDVLDCPPVLLKIFMSHGLFESTDWKPAAILAGGDAIDEKTWKELTEIEGADFYNMYGPTECTVEATMCVVKEHPRAASIGKSLANVEVYILDSSMQMAPVGISGELCIGGLSVGRGYLNRPELTSEKFIPDPFGKREGGRLYRTGDLARYLEDGTIEYLGRIDSQVKLRGFRIELGEIEHVLMQHPSVSDAVVVARERNGNKYLTGYITMKSEPEKDINEHEIQEKEIKEFLKCQLPDYMVPASIMVLERLPLTPNGKIDRKSLPEPLLEKASEGDSKPRTEQERILLEVWKEVLGLESIGLNDNFFETGGDSILAIQVVAKAREKGINIDPVHLFQHQTIEQLAMLIPGAREESNEKEDSDEPVKLLPVQKAFFEENFKQKDHWNQSVFFETEDKVKKEILEKIVGIIINHHDVLRSVFYKENSEWRMRINPIADKLPLEITDFSDLGEEELKSRLEIKAEEMQASLNIESGPVIRFAYFRLPEGLKDKLLIVAHHLVMDFVSWRIVLEDIMTLYNQLKQQKPGLLPPKSTPFSRWIDTLVRYSNTADFKKEADYWLKLPFNKWVPLTIDNKYDEYLEEDSILYNLSLGPEETIWLIREPQKTLNASVIEVLLTALTRAYSRWTEKRILMIDMEGHGRENISGNTDLSRTVGWFTSIYPVLLDLKSSIYPLESLKEVKEQLRSVPRHGIGFGILKYLIEDESIKGKIGTLPKSEICFNYLGQQIQFPQENNQTFVPLSSSKGRDRGMLNSVNYLIDITCFISGGIFQVQMRYSRKYFKENIIRPFLELFINELKLIIESSRSADVEYTTSDFPLANLNRKKFDKVLKRLNKITAKA